MTDANLPKILPNSVNLRKFARHVVMVCLEHGLFEQVKRGTVSNVLK